MPWLLLKIRLLQKGSLSSRLEEEGVLKDGIRRFTLSKEVERMKRLLQFFLEWRDQLIEETKKQRALEEKIKREKPQVEKEKEIKQEKVKGKKGSSKKRKSKASKSKSKASKKAYDEKCWIAKQTYENLRVQVCGFMAFAEAILNLGDLAPGFILYIRGNQSSVEALFSRLRAAGYDTPSKIAKGMADDDMKRECNEKKTGVVGSYLIQHTGDDVIEEKDDTESKDVTMSTDETYDRANNNQDTYRETVL